MQRIRQIYFIGLITLCACALQNKRRIHRESLHFLKRLFEVKFSYLKRLVFFQRLFQLSGSEKVCYNLRPGILKLPEKTGILSAQ
jgi:hypothetical protein